MNTTFIYCARPCSCSTASCIFNASCKLASKILRTLLGSYLTLYHSAWFASNHICYKVSNRSWCFYSKSMLSSKMWLKLSASEITQIMVVIKYCIVQKDFLSATLSHFHFTTTPPLFFAPFDYICSKCCLFKMHTVWSWSVHGSYFIFRYTGIINIQFLFQFRYRL